MSSIAAFLGTLVPGKGTRYILDGTQQLHSEIQKLQARILQLEEALTSVYAQVSDKPHPLLSGRREPPHEFASSSIQATEVESVQDALDALGTLAIGDLGQAKYFGPSAGTEPFITLTGLSIQRLQMNLPHLLIRSTLRHIFCSKSYQFPFKLGLDNHSLLHEVISQFPERLRASSLCESYAGQFAWSFAPVLREELIDDFLAPTYKLLEAIKEFPERLRNVLRPHRCAVLFLVFALGTWVDLTLDDYWMDADKFYHIARVCLSMQSIFEAPECATVQAIYLLSAYSEVRGHSTSMTLHPGWTLLSVASKIAQSLGLHRDVSKWNYLDSKTLDQRRHLFWDLATNEAHFSLGLGRPPSIRNSYIDAQVAADSGMVDSNGQPLQGYFNWKHQFARDILFDILETRLAVVPPSYETILTLDRRIREIPIPQHLNTLSFEDIDETRPPNRILQSGLPGLLRSARRFFFRQKYLSSQALLPSAVIISLHRTHFSQSLLDPSKNPLISPFAPSFLASYRAASWIIQCQRVFYLKYSDLMHRLWHPWTHALSACFILGCIVIHVPSSPIAENAFQDLNAMCDLYEIAASKTISLRTKNGWKIVQRIQARAKESYNGHKNANIDVMTNPPFPPSNSGDDELALFGGQTRTIIAKSSPTSTPLLKANFCASHAVH
ncbi:hypothetical protein DL96DRAFT_1463730 [Flagelloscypha sp. PMI_526]|nr:hypothetical protein DL96DRAFT_1463730 [Flagelloscypha sp. PMI_526]